MHIELHEKINKNNKKGGIHGMFRNARANVGNQLDRLNSQVRLESELSRTLTTSNKAVLRFTVHRTL